MQRHRRRIVPSSICRAARRSCNKEGRPRNATPNAPGLAFGRGSLLALRGQGLGCGVSNHKSVLCTPTRGPSYGALAGRSAPGAHLHCAHHQGIAVHGLQYGSRGVVRRISVHSDLRSVGGRFTQGFARDKSVYCVHVQPPCLVSSCASREYQESNGYANIPLMRRRARKAFIYSAISR